MLEDKAIQTYQIKFPFSIERIEVDVYKGNLWIKLKDDLKTAILHSIDINELRVNTIELNVKSYNFVLSAVHNDFMVFSKITDPAQIRDYEFLVYDLESKSLIKRISDRRFGGFSDSLSITAISTKFEEIHEEKVVLSSFRTSKDNENQKKESIKQPLAVMRGDERFEILEHLLKIDFSGEISGAVEILEHNQRIIICVHLKNEEDLIKKILILDQDFKLVYNEDIYTSINRRIADSFFVYANFVIFVSEFSTLNVLSLSN